MVLLQYSVAANTGKLAHDHDDRCGKDRDDYAAGCLRVTTRI